MQIAAYPIRIEIEHDCPGTENGSRGRVVRIHDADDDRTFWHVELRVEGDVPQDDACLEESVIVRNLLTPRPRVGRCPFCAALLSDSDSEPE